jgi:hypothetical protein
MIKEDGSLNEEYPDYNNFFLLLFIWCNNLFIFCHFWIIIFFSVVHFPLRLFVAEWNLWILLDHIGVTLSQNVWQYHHENGAKKRNNSW